MKSTTITKTTTITKAITTITKTITTITKTITSKTTRPKTTRRNERIKHSVYVRETGRDKDKDKDRKKSE